MPKFEKLRISLSREEPGALVSSIGHPEPHRSRAAFLTAVFGQERHFLRGTNARFRYLPIPMPEGFVGGFFARERPVVLSKENLSTYQAENYESALVIVDLSKDQFVWMEYNIQVGATKKLLESFLESVLKTTDIKDWTPYVRYIEVEDEYWNVIRTRKHEIARISFTFIPPNALGSDDRIYEFVKEVQGESNPETQQHVYKAPPGQMDPEGALMEASARVAMNGGGEAEVRDGNNRKIYSSGQARVQETVPEDDMPTPQQPGFVRRAILRLFGK